MKIIITFFYILIPTLFFAQSNEVINDKNFIGVIFPKTYKTPYHNILEESKRFTPSKEDIQIFERNLKIKLKKINTNRWNQTGNCPTIHRNLNKYDRQYLGFIDEKGRKYLFVNFLWKESNEERLMTKEYYNELGDRKKHWQIVLDGCSYYWSIKYYITSEELFDLQINGSA